MIDLAIVIGHNAARPGAWSETLQTSEYDWNKDEATLLVAAIHRLPGPAITMSVFERSSYAASYKLEMRQLTGAVNAARPRLIVSRHFNALNGKVHGCCALHYPGSARGALAAEVLSRAAATALGGRNIGAMAQAVSASGKPLHILRDTQAPAVILEPFFGDHEGDAERARTARASGSLAAALATTIQNLLRGWT